MKIALWITFTIITILWTGTVLVFSQLTGWLAATVASDQAGAVVSNVGQWPMPAWLSLFVDPAWVQEIQAAWVEVLGWLGQSGPAIGGMVSWFIPLMWVVWGLVMLLILVATIAGHFVVGRFSRPIKLAHSAP